MENGNVEMELDFLVGKKYGKSYDENVNSENCGWYSTKMLNFIERKFECKFTNLWCTIF